MILFYRMEENPHATGRKPDETEVWIEESLLRSWWIGEAQFWLAFLWGLSWPYRWMLKCCNIHVLQTHIPEQTQNSPTPKIGVADDKTGYYTMWVV